jgi:hypothetical protein
LCEASDARQDLIGRLAPHERLWVGVMRIDELANRRFELRHTAVCAAAQLFGRSGLRTSAPEIEPRSVRGVKCTWKRGRLINQFLMEGV